MGTFAVSVKDNGEYKFTYNDNRGKILVTSNSFKSKNECLENINLLKIEIENTTFTKHKTTANKLYFKILLNNETIGVSRKFTTVLRLENAIADIKLNIKQSEMLDFTSYAFPEINFEDSEL